MTLTSTTPGRRIAVRAILVVTALAALIVLAAPASAARSCGRAVIDDWYEDGRVDGTYALHCYDDAIDSLPRDVRDYSSAKDDIQRALQARMRGEEAPPATADPTPGAGPSDGGGTEAAPPTDTESASSVPIPLLILAGLALLLIAGGTAGYAIRRYQARRIPPAQA